MVQSVEGFFLAKFLLLCIHTLRTLLLIPISWQNCCTSDSSCFCILQPALSAKLNIFSFCSWVNLVLNLFFTCWSLLGFGPPRPISSCSSDSDGIDPIIMCWGAAALEETSVPVGYSMDFVPIIGLLWWPKMSFLSVLLRGWRWPKV